MKLKSQTIVPALTQSVSLWLESRWLVWVIFALGVFLRVVPYLINRSLWVDEAIVSQDIVSRSWLGLLQPLDYDEAAPIGFLFAQKLIVLMLGNNEYALRLLALLAGIGSLALFYVLARKMLSSSAALLAFALFALLNSHIYFSSEAKQYSGDVLAAIFLLILAQNLHQSSDRKWLALFWLGLVGAAAVWFSHPSVFVLAGIGMTLGIYNMERRAWRLLLGLIAAGILWITSFAALYVVSLRYLDENASLDSQWQFALAPLPLQPTAILRWLATVLTGIFVDPLNLPLPGLVLFCVLVGAIALFMQNRWTLALAISPLGFALVAAILQKYPFSGRLLLFAVPMLLMILAHGVVKVYDSTRERGQFIGLLLIALLLFSSLAKATVRLQTPQPREEIKPVMAYLRDHLQPGDTLYVYYWAQFTFQYYKDKYGIGDYTLGVRWNENSWNLAADDLSKLRGKSRVWVLFSQAYRGNEEEPEERFVRYNLDRLGTLLSSKRVIGASVYLYDLSR